MSPPLVSVALATCDGARFLREQLDTVYAQTWPHLEVVASDDASTDGTAAILAEYAAARGLRHAVNPRRLGLAGNFERAIGLCRGELIALCDQDDLWKPEKLARLVAEIGDYTLIYCNPQEVLPAAGARSQAPAAEAVYRFARRHGTGRPTRHLLAENWVVSHTLLFKHELLAHALPFPPGQHFHDGWLALVASKLGGIKYIDEPLQTYREHPASLTWTARERAARNGGPLAALVSGRFRADWRAKCRGEVARLTGALRLPLLEPADRAFAQELLTYYRAGLEGGRRWAAFRSGLHVAPYIASLHGRARWKVPLRPLLGGL